ncbi:efflux transporter outer membrane subunit [Sphingobium sp. AP49]|uniref:efflux transporter outer membrane subunit n=1 Tax=Sphingobium sp. AP49 TaxID=1144307 RepID=UPI00026ECB59|nr:efflux transporter outer membrane subunit [Sphingobium sp. AP49]WHO38186.1 efflux transporter outer membrane subunit [Sphingobium sp. AP49]
MSVSRITFSARTGVLAATALLLSGCASIPDLGPKPEVRTPQAVAAQQSLAAAATAWPGDGWWKGYGDPQLGVLIEEGLNGSPDVAAAAARLRKAAGMAQQAGAALLPSLDAQGSPTLDKQSYNNGFPKEFVPKGWQDRGQVAASLNFDIDLWGKNRAALAAATSERQAAEIDVAQARLMLSTGIADAYADLARLYAERDTSAAALDIRTATQKLTDDRVRSGLDTRGDLRQSESEVATSRANLAAADEQIALRRNQIAALLGAGPDRGLTIARPAIASLNARGLPAGITTDLVGRRPDVAAARARVEAAASRIKVARADFFPAISISGLIGAQSLGLEYLFKKDSIYGNVGPAISLPLFHGGALSGQYRGARATYDEAVATYDGTVIDAYREVADTVTSQKALDDRLRESHAALTASEEAYAIARKRYEGGLSTYLQVLVVQERLLTARQVVAQLDSRAFSLDVALIRALGGGFAAGAALSKDGPNG